MGGWRVAEFEEIRELGEGGQGRVVLARHAGSGTPVAIKYVADDADRQMLRREAQMLGQVANRHVARLFRLVETPSGAAIVMEAVNGVALRKILERYSQLEPEAALTVLKGSLLGLAAAHAAGVVHRDYKPANVVVQADGLSKLIDFGIATAAGTGSRSGTPAYMAPEQWNGQAATPATDVYAATCVLFECLTGRRPYEGPSLRDLHVSAPVPVTAVPEPLRPIVELGMAKSPADRPPGALEFVGWLEEVARNAYGADWEARGQRRLSMAAAALAALFPLAALGGSIAGGAGAAGSAGSAVGQGVGAAKASFLSTVTGKAAVAGTAAVTIAGAAGIYAVTRSSEPQTPPPIAYATTSQVVVQPSEGNATVLARLPANTAVEHLTWSPDRQSVAWTQTTFRPDGLSVESERIAQARVDGSAPRSWTCEGGCHNVWFQKGKLYSLTYDTGDHAGAGSLRAVHEYRDGRRVELDVDKLFPWAPEPHRVGIVQPIPGSGDALVVEGTHEQRDRALYRVRPDGKATRLALAGGGERFGLDIRYSSDGRRAAVVMPITSADACGGDGVGVLDLTRGTFTRHRPPVATSEENTDLWFDTSGVLFASFTPAVRASGGECRPDTAGKRIYQLDGGRWVPARSQQGRYTRSGWWATLDGGTRKIGFDERQVGTLTVRHGEQTRRLSGDVMAYAWPPSS